MNDDTTKTIKTVEEKALALPDQVRALPEIVDQATLDCWTGALSYIRGVIREIKGTFGPIKTKTFAAHKETIAQEKKHLDPAETSERIAKATIGKYVDKQERRRRDAEILARQESERLRKEAEEKAAKAAELENKETEDPAEAQAVFDEAIEAQERADKADEAIPEAPKMSGGHTRQIWRFTIHSPDLVPQEFLMPDEALIGRTVKAMRGKAKIPGVRVYPETVVVGGR